MAFLKSDDQTETYKKKSKKVYENVVKETSELELELNVKERTCSDKREYLQKIEKKIRDIGAKADEFGAYAPDDGNLDFYKNRYEKLKVYNEQLKDAKKGIESITADSDATEFEKIIHNMTSDKSAGPKKGECNMLDSKIANYLNKVTEKFSIRKPEYYSTNKGNVFTEKKNWTGPKLDVAKQRVSLSYIVDDKERAKLECKHTGLPSNEIFLKKNESLRKTGKFIAECYVVTKADEKTREFVEGFSSYNYIVCIYETSHGGNLIYNKNDDQTKIFSAYFDPTRKNPKTLTEIFRNYADEKGFLPESKVNSLNFRGAETKKKLESDGYLIRLDRRYIVN